MTDQLNIQDDGSIGSQPVTWDGEPLYSSATVKEGLFDADAFEQMPGQLAIEEPAETRLRRRTVFEPCEKHAAWFARESRYRRGEVMVEGGFASSPCSGDGCRMKPGTDLYTASFVAANPVSGVQG